jgi:excisionase family DNA binding protein
MKRFVGPEELAEYLDLSINTIYSWIWLKKIPHFKVGKLVKFDLQEIETWMEEKKIEVRV